MVRLFPFPRFMPAWFARLAWGFQLGWAFQQYFDTDPFDLNHRIQVVKILRTSDDTCFYVNWWAIQDEHRGKLIADLQAIYPETWLDTDAYLNGENDGFGYIHAKI